MKDQEKERLAKFNGIRKKDFANHLRETGMIRCRTLLPPEIREYQNLKSVLLPTWSRRLQVLPGHAESFIPLGPGDIILILLWRET